VNRAPICTARGPAEPKVWPAREVACPKLQAIAAPPLAPIVPTATPCAQYAVELLDTSSADVAPVRFEILKALNISTKILNLYLSLMLMTLVRRKSCDSVGSPWCSS